MEEIDPGRYVLPVLLALLMLGTFLIIVTNGGGDDPEAGAVDRPARSSSRTTTTATTAATTAKTTSIPVIPPAPGAVPAGARFVKVQPGDTPTSIADRAGISPQRLLELNPSVEPDALKPGQTLKLAP
jgi:LysM repeat protein